jgi:hypothetical protein
MKIQSLTKLLGIATVSFLAQISFAQAGELISNGGFETCDFTGWNANVELGSAGNLFVVLNNGGTSPLSGFPYQLNATGGNCFAITDQTGPGSYSLTQSFVVAPGTTDVTVSFQLFANDQDGGPFSTDPNRDFNTFPNQNAEVDILTGAANAFTVTPSDILATLYGPGADNLSGNPNPWTTYFADLGALAPGTYQIRFAETDNQFFFQMGVDNVSVFATVPEPATLSLLGLGLAGIGFARRRRAN